MAKKVMILATSADKYPQDNAPTGSWYEELAAPYYVFKEQGYEVVVASMAGGKIPFDPASSSEAFLTEPAKKLLADVAALEDVNNSKKLSDVDIDQLDAIFLPGGHGVLFDMPEDAYLAEVLAKMYTADKVVAAVCHGPAGLVSAKKADGTSILAGHKVAGFTNEEEAAVGKTEIVPFLLEDKLKELGGVYEKADNWAVFAVRDGNVVTGQNPQSSELVAQKIVEALS